MLEEDLAWLIWFLDFVGNCIAWPKVRIRLSSKRESIFSLNMMLGEHVTKGDTDIAPANPSTLEGHHRTQPQHPKQNPNVMPMSFPQNQTYGGRYNESNRDV